MWKNVSPHCAMKNHAQSSRILTLHPLVPPLVLAPCVKWVLCPSLYMTVLPQQPVVSWKVWHGHYFSYTFASFRKWGVHRSVAIKEAMLIPLGSSRLGSAILVGGWWSNSEYYKDTREAMSDWNFVSVIHSSVQNAVSTLSKSHRESFSLLDHI